MVGADMVIVVVCLLWIWSLRFFFIIYAWLWSYMTLLFAVVRLCACVSVGCVYPSYAEARCMLIILYPLDASFEPIKLTFFWSIRLYGLMFPPMSPMLIFWEKLKWCGYLSFDKSMKVHFSLADKCCLSWIIICLGEKWRDLLFVNVLSLTISDKFASVMPALHL